MVRPDRIYMTLEGSCFATDEEDGIVMETEDDTSFVKIFFGKEVH